MFATPRPVVPARISAWLAHLRALQERSAGNAPMRANARRRRPGMTRHRGKSRRIAESPCNPATRGHGAAQHDTATERAFRTAMLPAIRYSCAAHGAVGRRRRRQPESRDRKEEPRPPRGEKAVAVQHESTRRGAPGSGEVHITTGACAERRHTCGGSGGEGRDSGQGGARVRAWRDDQESAAQPRAVSARRKRLSSRIALTRGGKRQKQ